MNLYFVKLFRCDITDRGLRALADFSLLSHLELHPKNDCLITSAGLQMLGNLNNLETLALHGMCLKEKDGLKLDFVAKLGSLRKLKVDRSKITDISVANLTGISHLIGLRLFCCPGRVSTDALLSLLRPLTKLQLFCMDLFDRDVNSVIEARAIICTLSKLCSLKEVSLRMLLVDDAMVQTLCESSPNLTALELRGEHVTNHSIRSYLSITSDCYRLVSMLIAFFYYAYV